MLQGINKCCSFVTIFTALATSDVVGLSRQWSDSVSSNRRNDKPKCSIAILDFSHPSINLSSCNPENRVFEESGILKTKALTQDGSGSHATSQFAGPHWLQQAIRASEHYTDDMDSADAVIVNDYCQMMLALSLHEPGSDGLNVAISDLSSGYSRLTQLSRFQRHDGADFVFFTPFPIFGIVRFNPVTCESFARSMHIIIEGAMRYICPHAARKNYLIVPYASTQFELNNKLPSDRNIEIFFYGHCSGFHGKKMRSLVVEQIEQHLDAFSIFVQCRTTFEDNHDALRGVMQRSTFCLVIPGDTASSRRLTEIILAGCIPVFVGSPWHSMPLAALLDYPKFALFVELEQLVSLEGVQVLDHALENDTATDVFQPEWWIADADITSNVYHVANVSSMVDYLRSIRPSELHALQQNGVAARSLFRYQSHLEPQIKTVPDVIMQTICAQYVKNIV